VPVDIVKFCIISNLILDFSGLFFNRHFLVFSFICCAGSGVCIYL